MLLGLLVHPYNTNTITNMETDYFNTKHYGGIK